MFGSSSSMTAAVVFALTIVCGQGFLVAPSSSGISTRYNSRLSMSAASAARAETVPASLHAKDTKVKTIKTHDDFLETMAGSSDRPVVIKFYDTFCRACKAVAPKFERMASENPGVSFHQIEFSASKDLCKSLGIRVLPTVHIYQGAQGKIVDLPVGPKRFQKAEEALAEVLSNSKGANGAVRIPQEA